MSSWQSRSDQQKRINTLGDWLRAELPRLFNFAGHISDRYAPAPTVSATRAPPLADYLAETLVELERAHGASFLDQACAEILCYPAQSPLRPAEGDWSGASRALAAISDTVARSWLRHRPSSYAIALLAGRAQYILAHPFDGAELPRMAMGDHPINGYCTPTLKDIGEMLGELRDEPAALDPIQRLVAGDWNVKISIPPEWAERHVPHTPTSYGLFGSQLSGSFRDFYQMLHRQGLLDYDAFCRSVRQLPYAAPGYLLEQSHDEATGFDAVFRDWTRRLVWETCATLDQPSLGFLEAFWNWKLFGARWLLRACQHATATGLRPTAEHYTGPERAIRWFAEIHSLEPEDDPEAVVAQLRTSPPDVLEALLPFARAARPLVLRALGWDHAEPLLRAILRVGACEGDLETDIGNSADPTVGIVDRHEVAESLSTAGPLARRLIAALQRAKTGPKNAITLVEAVGGWNAASLLKSLRRDSQIALKAYGLLPLQEPREVTERYLRLRQAERDCRKYGLERQANTKAAVQVGLANLAQTAGFADAARLEWAMEAQVSEQVPAVGSCLNVQSWQLELTLAAGKPEIVVMKAGKRLASVPPAVRKSAAYATIREALETTRAQARRFRSAMERMMTESEPVGEKDMDSLGRLPVARSLLRHLIIVDAQGRLGLPDPEAGRLQMADGSNQPLAHPIRIAHVFDLYGADCLAEWQRAIVRRRIVQPFKQAFRELYLLTPEERAAGSQSLRFAGHHLEPRIAARLLQARDWQTDADETEVVPFKPFRNHGIIAVFRLRGARYYLGGSDDDVVTDRIQFTRATSSWHWDPDLVELAEIPPRLFSEVMRDADLLVSVARPSKDSFWSTETVRGRADIVSALVAEMGLPGVVIEDPYVRVTGQLASYRIHLGSAAVHIEPGRHLCIVPAEAVAQLDLFLPFTDDDPGSAEVISKLLLLADDAHIEDPSILSQIQSVARRP